MITMKVKGMDEAILEAKRTGKAITPTVTRVLTDVLVNDMLRDAKINAQHKVLRRGKGGGTGHLSRNIFHKVWETRNKTIGSLFVDLNKVPYARIHEKGGTIVPRRAKALTIPFPGVKGFARDFQFTFIAKGIIFQKIGLTEIKPLFILKRRVTIPRRAYLEPAIRKHQEKLRLELIKALDKK